MIKAEVIADSVSPQGRRLTTFKLRYMRFIHAEFMTHRKLSRNASGSRAVPTARFIEEVRTDHLRASPVYWGKNQKGMQAAEELDGDDLHAARMIWEQAALEAADSAERMARAGAHKQIVNRILEPFSHINVVASATEWTNFFGLRLHKDAQPEIRALAEAMWAAREESTPEELSPGEWHLPFANGHHDVADALRFSRESQEAGHWFGRFVDPQEALLWTSTARCARVSYESFETGKPSTIEEDVKLFMKLLGSHPVHASPAEHQATPDEAEAISFHDPRPAQPIRWKNPENHGNLDGWRQHRKLIPGEDVAPLPEEYR
jgi:hypothetical protein